MKPLAVIKTGGKQYIVEEGSVIVVDKIDAKPKEKVIFDNVLMFAENSESIQIGEPFLQGAKVLAQVLEQGKGGKIKVARFSAKSRHRKVKGFRQQLTKLAIKKITVS